MSPRHFGPGGRRTRGRGGQYNLRNKVAVRVEAPLGYAMVGGLAVSQLLTLYTTPVVYLYLDRFQRWLRPMSAAPLQPQDVQIAAE